MTAYLNTHYPADINLRIGHKTLKTQANKLLTNISTMKILEVLATEGRKFNEIRVQTTRKRYLKKKT